MSRASFFILFLACDPHDNILCSFGFFRWLSWMKAEMLVYQFFLGSLTRLCGPTSLSPLVLSSPMPLGLWGFLASCLLPCQLPLIFFLFVLPVLEHTHAKVSRSYLYYFCSCLTLAESSPRAESMFCSSLLPPYHLAQCPVQSGCLITSC